MKTQMSSDKMTWLQNTGKAKNLENSDTEKVGMRRGLKKKRINLNSE